MCVLVASDSALDRWCRRVFQISCWNRWMVRARVTNSGSRDRRAQEIHPASSTFPRWPFTANTALYRAYLLKEQLRAVLVRLIRARLPRCSGVRADGFLM